MNKTKKTTTTWTRTSQNKTQNTNNKTQNTNTNTNTNKNTKTRQTKRQQELQQKFDRIIFWTTKQELEQQQKRLEQIDNNNLNYYNLTEQELEQLTEQQKIVVLCLQKIENYYKRQKKQLNFEQDRLWLQGLEQRHRTIDKYIINKIDNNNTKQLDNKLNYKIFKQLHNKYVWLLDKKTYNNYFLNDNDNDKTTIFIDYRTQQEFDNKNNIAVIEFMKKNDNDRKQIERLQQQLLEQQQQIDIDYYNNLNIEQKQERLQQDKKQHNKTKQEQRQKQNYIEQLQKKYNDFFYWTRQDYKNYKHNNKRQTQIIDNDLNYWQKLQELEHKQNKNKKRQDILNKQQQLLQDKLQDKLQELEHRQQQLLEQIKTTQNNYKNLTKDKNYKTRQQLLIKFEQQQRFELQDIQDKIYKTKYIELQDIDNDDNTKQIKIIDKTKDKQQRLELLNKKNKVITYHKRLATYRTKQHRLLERQKRHTKAIEQQLELEQELEQTQIELTK